MDSSQQNYSSYVDAISYEIPSSINQIEGNQVIQDSSFYMDDYFQQPYDSYDSSDAYDSPIIVNIQNITSEGFLSPPLENIEEYYTENYEDLKPIIIPDFAHQNHYIANLSPSNETNYDNQDECGNNIIQEIEYPDLKVMPSHITLPQNIDNIDNSNVVEDVKPYIMTTQSLPSPPTSPETCNNSSAKPPRLITSINVDVKPIKQEDDDVESEQKQDDIPVFVNPKQFNRILKRRIAREKFKKKHNISDVRKPYIHESRHNHAIRRPRGPGGRFLNANEIESEENKRKNSLNSTSSSCDSPTTPESTHAFFPPTTYTYNESFQPQPILFDSCKSNDQYFTADYNLNNSYEEFSQLQTQTFYQPSIMFFNQQ